jgi:hypothetical protein
MAVDDSTYGFSRQDASDLLGLIVGGVSEYRENRPRPRSAPSEGWLLKTTEEIPPRDGLTLGKGKCIVCHRDGVTIVETEEEIHGYNGQEGQPIPADSIVQAKRWQGVPLIDVASCDDEEET